jgi:hypothetical protein
MQVKQEDLDKFWAWCGWELKQEEIIDASKRKVTMRSAWRNGIETQFPDLDLNSIYKYAIPKLQKEGYTIDLTASEECFTANIFYKDGRLSNDASDSPAKALFNAIMKVIENATK